YLADEGYIQFYYCVHEWEAISEEWAEGTYTISSGKYYEYGSVLWLDGKVKDTSSGKLKIKHNSNGYSTFDIDLKNVVGHFEGKLTN
ncbi:MAG: hypothetical protein Q4D41_12240, partial [Prevotellaceae bacterium]|nr:hypothetical protein [Prevotellaceae bacterium]